MPIRNEALNISSALSRVFAQDYPSDSMELLVADGMSDDKTRQIVWDFSVSHPEMNIRVLNNPGKIVPTGMNIAMRQAKGEIIIRVDGHCIIASDYVRRCVEHIQKEGVDGVGGPMESIGETSVAKAIAIGMSSPFGVGNSAFRTTTNQSMLVDTVPFPAYTREVIQRAGFYDEELVRNQDDEYNYRIRELGGTILLADDVRSSYFSRTSLRALWRQYFQYGFWKIRVLQKHPLQMSPRQFAPPALALALLFSALLGLVPLIRPLDAALGSLARAVGLLALVPPLLYVMANLAASVITSAKRGWNYLPLLPVTFAILHIGYGLGFLLGLVRFATRWGDRVGRVPEWSAGRTARVEPLVPVYRGPVGSCGRSLLQARL